VDDVEGWVNSEFKIRNSEFHDKFGESKSCWLIGLLRKPVRSQCKSTFAGGDQSVFGVEEWDVVVSERASRFGRLFFII
jgi:hypothetical protein